VKIINDAVTTPKIVNDAVTTAKIANLNVTTGKLALDAVTNAQLADNSVQTENIVDGQVQTNDIANLNVTTGKLADNAVTTLKITDANVTYGKIQNVSATDKVLGRISVGAGVVEEISTTGSGNVVRATSPTLVSPNLGTPSSLVGTNITGTAAGLTAGTVTTNANLTGEVTSVGNTTTITNSAVLGKVLTGYVSGAGTLLATDNILQAIQKLNGNSVAWANATHTGDATGATALTVVGINGTLLSGLGTGILKNTTGTGVPSIAVAGTDYLEPDGDGSALTGLTGGQITGNISGNAANVTGTVGVTNGGTGLSSTTINQLLYSSAANTIAGLATSNNGILVTNGTGIPSISNTVGAALTMPSLNLSASSNQLVLQSAGNAGTLTWSPTAPRTITFPDATGTVALVGSPTNWSISGNTGTNPASNFIGTIDNQDMVFKTNNTETMRIEASTGDMIFGGASVGTVKANQELIMRQDGDTYGPTIMRLRNRTGENGAIFETTDGTITLVDFIFKTASNQRNIRYESRVANARTGNPSFHIGGLLPDKPTLSIGDNYAAFGKSITIGRYTQPTARLQIAAGTADTAALKFTSGPLLASPQVGAVEFLTDKFYGTITTGAARKTFAFLESPAFTTPNIGAATGTSLQLSGLTTSRPVKTDGSGNLTATQIALNSTNDVTGTLPVGNGGTGLTSGNNGGIPYYSSNTTMASSAVLAANSLMIGGGAGSAPSTLAMGTSNQILAVNSTGTGYTHRSIKTVLGPDWGENNLLSGETNLPLGFSSNGTGSGNGGARFYLPYGGVIKGIIVSGSAARTAGTATFTIYKDGVSTGITGVIDGTNTQYVSNTGGSVSFVAGNYVDIRVTTTGTFAPSGSTEYVAWIVVEFTE
jgi:hypothetical protein